MNNLNAGQFVYLFFTFLLTILFLVLNVVPGFGLVLWGVIGWVVFRKPVLEGSNKEEESNG